MASSTTNYLQENKERFLIELIEFLRIPSISAQEEYKSDTRRAAEWLRDRLTKIGIENSQLIETPGYPVVYGDWLKAPGKPTMLIYGHYDVQSPDPLDQWQSPPFEPQVRGGNLYGRGTADDKGQIFTYLAAIEAFLVTQKSLPVNVKFLIEGEEEVGGPNMDDFLAKHTEQFRADVCLISDSHAKSPTQPLIPYGLKGLVYFQLDLQVLNRDVHSGTYGGNVPNAALELNRIIAAIKDLETQRILIPGFYENVRQLSDAEVVELAASDFDDQAIKTETGAKEVVGVRGLSVADRAGAKPTLDVNGMHAGYTGQGPKTIIPSQASAKVSMRIVPNQTSKEIATKFIAYVEKITPSYVNLQISLLSSGEPILMTRDSAYFKKVEEAMTAVFGNKPQYCLEGGSIPITSSLKTLLGIDSVLMGWGLPDDGLHSPNEKISIDMFYKGIDTIVEYLQDFE